MENTIKINVEYPFQYEEHIEMQNLEKKYIPHEFVSEPNETFKWFEKDTKSAIILKTELGKVIGHMSLFPIVNLFASNLLDGSANDIELTEEDIETDFSRGDILYFCVACIDEKYRTKKNLALLYRAYYDILDFYKYFQADFTRVLTHCVTHDGVKMAKKLGFHSVTDEYLGVYSCDYKVFELSLDSFAKSQGIL